MVRSAGGCLQLLMWHAFNMGVVHAEMNGRNLAAFSLGSAVCEVEIDGETGQARLAELPITPERVLEALREQRGEG